MKEFSDITESSPYTCARCLKATYLEAISVMKDTIAALQLEVSELRSALSTLSSKQREQESQPTVSQTNRGTSESWADVARRSNRRPNRQQKNGNSSRRAAREVTGQRNTAENHHSGSEVRQSPRSTTAGPQRPRAHVAGARKVWGTHSNATVGEVKGAISMIANLSANDLTVKRKLKVMQGNRRPAKWWFVLRAEENILKGLEKTWNTMALPRRWKIEPLLRYNDNVTPQPHTRAQSCNRSTDQHSHYQSPYTVKTDW